MVIKREYNEQCFFLIELFIQLNNKGMDKTLEYIEDLLEIEK